MLWRVHMWTLGRWIVIHILLNEIVEETETITFDWKTKKKIHFHNSTYKFSCRGISTEDSEIYKAKNLLHRKLDRDLDVANTSPIERCHGVVVSGIWCMQNECSIEI